MSAYVEIGCIVKINPFQTFEYVNGGLTIPGTSMPSDLYPDDLAPIATAARLETSFTTPSDDDAWWVDPSRPELRNFGGWWVDTFQLTREVERQWRVVQATRPVARPGKLTDKGYVIVLEGSLHGATCCSVTAGWAAIQSMLTRECDPCVGTSLSYVAMPCGDSVGCEMPLAPESESPAGHWRTLFGVALAETPMVVESFGSRCATCACGPFTRVRVALRAQPGRFSNPVTSGTFALIPSGVTAAPYVAPGDCFTEEIHDPLVPAPGPPTRPPVVTESVGVVQTHVAHSVIRVDTTNSLLFSTAGVISVGAGAGVLRNLRLRWWREQPGAADFAYDVCNAYGGISIPYLPSGTTITIDGRTSTAILERSDGSTTGGRQLVRGANSGPWPGDVELPPGRWLIRVEADPNNTSSSASITVATSIVEP